MPDEPTNPIEPEATQESISSPPARGELGEGSQAQDSLRPFDEKRSNEWTVPVREMPEAEGVSVSESVIEPPLQPVSEPVVIVPEPTSEPVVLPEPVVVIPTESAPEPIVEVPISEPVIIPEPSVVPAPVLETSHSVLVTNPEPTPTPEPKLDSFHINMARARELLVKARYAIQLNKKKKIDKIMGLFLKKTKVTNREVRDLLRLSHDMVNVYMNTLIKEGKIKREGKSSATHYTKL